MSGRLDTSGTFSVDGPQDFPFEPLLQWQLRERTDLPVCDPLIAACRRAVLLAADGQYDSPIALPPGIRTDDGRRTQVAWELVATFALQALVEIVRRWRNDEGEIVDAGPEFFDIDPADDG